MRAEPRILCQNYGILPQLLTFLIRRIESSLRPKGRVDDLLRKYLHIWGLRAETTTAYLCGHPKIIEHSQGILERAGWKKDAILEEAYYHVAIKEAGGPG